MVPESPPGFADRHPAVRVEEPSANVAPPTVSDVAGPIDPDRRLRHPQTPWPVIRSRGLKLQTAKASVNPDRYKGVSTRVWGPGGHQRREGAPGVAELAYEQIFQVLCLNLR